MNSDKREYPDRQRRRELRRGLLDNPRAANSGAQCGLPYGEIDLVMEQGTTVVFVEVRLRTHMSIQSGAGSVDYRKQQRLIRAATHLIQRTPALQERPIRFDVIAYNTRHRNRVPYWIQQAFDASI